MEQWVKCCCIDQSLYQLFTLSSCETNLSLSQSALVPPLSRLCYYVRSWYGLIIPSIEIWFNGFLHCCVHTYASVQNKFKEYYFTKTDQKVYTSRLICANNAESRQGHDGVCGCDRTLWILSVTGWYITLPSDLVVSHETMSLCTAKKPQVQFWNICLPPNHCRVAGELEPIPAWTGWRRVTVYSPWGWIKSVHLSVYLLERCWTRTESRTFLECLLKSIL